MNKTPKQIVDAVRRAGVVGAGGAGFPTHVKLQAQVDTVIVNGSECEPLLSSDRTMMEQKPEQIIAGLLLAMQATGAKEGIVALKEHYTDAIVVLKKVLPSDKEVRLHLMDNYYPAGDEFLMVYDVTGKVIPEGGLPLHVGVVVNNVMTMMQIADAVNGKPVTHRTVTIAGLVRNPKVVTVPIGTTYEDLIAIAGGLTQSDAVIMDGGPMMGKIVEDLSCGIAKTCGGIIALPPDQFVIRMKQKPIGQVIKQSKSACCQCMRCTDLCPRNLLGHDIFPHMTMRTIDYNIAEPTKHVTSAFLCSQCGVCELVACDIMLLSPRKIFAAYKEELIRRGVQNPHKQKVAEVRSGYENAKSSIEMVMKKLGLTEYDSGMPFEGMKSVDRVRIALNGHTGVPAIPSVKKGATVRMCDPIAASPEDKLGAVYHASIGGKVSDVGEHYIEITK